MLVGMLPPGRAAGAAADVYLVTNLSCIDLPTLEEYAQEVRPPCTPHSSLELVLSACHGPRAAFSAGARSAYGLMPVILWTCMSHQ